MSVEREAPVFIRFECPKCRGALAISARHIKANKVVNCGHCGLKVLIPTESEPQISPQASETHLSRQQTQTKPRQKPELSPSFQEVFIPISAEPEPTATEPSNPITEYPVVTNSSPNPNVSKRVIGKSKHIRFFRSAYLESDETILATAPGWIGKMMGSGDDTQHNGELIVTTRQVVFYRKGLMGEVFETIPIKGISSIHRKSFVGCHTITLHTSHKALEFKSFDGNALLAVTNLVNQLRTDPQLNSSPVAEAPELRDEYLEIESVTTKFRKRTEGENFWVWVVVGFCAVLLVCFGSLRMGPSNKDQAKLDQRNTRPVEHDRYTTHEHEEELKQKDAKKLLDDFFKALEEDERDGTITPYGREILRNKDRPGFLPPGYRPPE